MEHVSTVPAAPHALVVVPAPLPEAPFSLEGAPVFQAFMAETQRLAHVRPAPGLATAADVPLPIIFERSLWAVMVRIAQKVGVGYTDGAALIAVAAPRATRLLAVALPFAYETPTAAAEAFLAAMPPSPSRLADAGEVWLQAAAQAATSFFAAALRDLAETVRRFRILKRNLSHKNHAPYGKLGWWLSPNASNAVPNDVLEIVEDHGGPVEPAVRGTNAADRMGLALMTWERVRPWADFERHAAELEEDLRIGTRVAKTLSALPNDARSPAGDLLVGWIRTQFLLAAINAAAPAVWIESPEIPRALEAAAAMGADALCERFRHRAVVQLGIVEADEFSGRFDGLIRTQAAAIVRWAAKPEVLQQDVDALFIRVIGRRSSSLIRDRILHRGEGEHPSIQDPKAVLSAFEWENETAETFRRALPSLQEDPWCLAQAYFGLPKEQRKDPGMRVAVEQSLRTDGRAYARAAAAGWVPMTRAAFREVGAELSPHRALVALKKLVLHALDGAAFEDEDAEGLFLDLLFKTDPLAFQKIADDHRLRSAIRDAIRRDVIDLAPHSGGSIQVVLPPEEFQKVRTAFGDDLWAIYVLSMEIAHRDMLLGESSSCTLSEEHPLEPWPQMRRFNAGDAEVMPGDLNALLGVDDAGRQALLARFDEDRVLRWTFAGEAKLRGIVVEYHANIARYFAARGLMPNGKPLGPKPDPKPRKPGTAVPVEKKRKPSSALPSRPPRKR